MLIHCFCYDVLHHGQCKKEHIIIWINVGCLTFTSHFRTFPFSKLTNDNMRAAAGDFKHSPHYFKVTLPSDEKTGPNFRRTSFLTLPFKLNENLYTTTLLHYTREYNAKA